MLLFSTFNTKKNIFYCNNILRQHCHMTRFQIVNKIYPEAFMKYSWASLALENIFQWLFKENLELSLKSTIRKSTDSKFKTLF